MDLTDALTIWTALSHKHEIKGEDREDAYYTLFIKNGDVVGHIKANGSGFFWEYPQELLDASKNETIMATIRERHSLMSDLMK